MQVLKCCSDESDFLKKFEYFFSIWESNAGLLDVNENFLRLVIYLIRKFKKKKYFCYKLTTSIISLMVIYV